MIERMSEEEIFEGVREVIVEVLRNSGSKVDEDQIERGTDLIEDSNVDSLDIVEISIALEEEFSLDAGEIEDEEVEEWRKVEDII